MPTKDANEIAMRGERLDPTSARPIDVGPHEGPAIARPDLWAPIGPGWFEDEPPPRRYLLNYTPKDSHGLPTGDPAGLMAAGRVGFLVGAGSVGKSYALTALALAVATGRDVFSAPGAPSPIEVVSPGSVVLIMAEEERDEMRRRVWHTARLMGLSGGELETAGRRITIIPLAGEAVSLVQHATPAMPDLRGEFVSEVGEALGAALDLHAPADGWRLVALDPLSRFAGVDAEKDNAAATRFVQVLERMTHAPGGPTVLVAHHSSQAARKARGEEQSGARGVTGLTDGARWVADLEGRAPADGGADSGLVDLRFKKNNYARHAPPVVLARDGSHQGALRIARAPEIRQHDEAQSEAKRAESRSGNGADHAGEHSWKGIA